MPAPPKLFYRRWGDSGIPVLLLHGHPGDGACWEPLIPSLCGWAEAVAPDLRGYGRSPCRDPFVMDDHLRDLWALVEHLGWSRFGVVGWSLGGILALELALAEPQRILGLTLIASAARPQGSHPPVPWWMEVNTALASLLNLIWVGDPWIIDTFGKHSLYRYLVAQHTPATYQALARYAVPAYFRTSKMAHTALGQALRQGYDRLEPVTQLTMPTLVMAAEHDVHITPASSRQTAEQMPAATWKLYPNTAHLFPWEIPEQVGNDLRQWWASQVIPIRGDG